jgi:hypothetical protein
LVQAAVAEQLIRQHDTIRDRTVEITFLEPGAEAERECDEPHHLPEHRPYGVAGERTGRAAASSGSA